MGCACLVCKRVRFFVSLHILRDPCDAHHTYFNTYPIIELSSFSSTFVEGSSGWIGDFVFNYIFPIICKMSQISKGREDWNKVSNKLDLMDTHK